MVKKSLFVGMLALVLVFGVMIVGCASMKTQQYGEVADDAIALNLTVDSGTGKLYVTHVNGEATGAKIGTKLFLFFGDEDVYVNPVYVKMTGKPIVFTIRVPVTSDGGKTFSYKSCELTLSKLADLKGGDVLTLKYMYQTQTFAFVDATGNIVQQTIPTFK
ncbi:hypothetical protein FACS1894130_04530 [Spirochaetia bacterium]|nr:hypothetical protein FACS1894130_04530 [Spirochaetia bacterium]